MLVHLQTGIPISPPFGGFEKQLIEDEIVTLKSKGASKEVTYCSNEFHSNIILVTKKTGDMRPVINLKPLNVFVQKIHFKMENINTALHTIAPGDYLVSIDLKDAYFSILFLNLIANFCDSSGQTRHMNLLVCLLAIVLHLEFSPRS